MKKVDRTCFKIKGLRTFALIGLGLRPERSMGGFRHHPLPAMILAHPSGLHLCRSLALALFLSEDERY
jgi:hypothetical protein